MVMIVRDPYPLPMDITAHPDPNALIIISCPGSKPGGTTLNLISFLACIPSQPNMASPQPKNRRERRAAAHKGTANNNAKPKTIDEIAMELPNRTRPEGKTLFELAEERQAELDEKAGKPPRIKKQQWQDKYGMHGEADFMSDEPLGPLGDAVLYGSSLSMMHFTLDVLVYNQYRQEILWKEIFSRTAIAAPILMLLVYMLHPTPRSRYLALLKQIFFLVTSITAGCYLMFSANKYGYYAIMKRAPGLGTLWVWSVIEMQLPYALSGLAAVAGYAWWNNLGAF